MNNTHEERSPEYPLRAGRIECITGPMFAGKSEELLHRMRSVAYARRTAVLLKPKIDVRFSASEVVSHNQTKMPAICVSTPQGVWEASHGFEVVGIDEVQFLPEIVPVCEVLARAGKRVIVAGLDMDYRGQPFGPIPQLLARAEYVTKLCAVCTVCGNPATRTQRHTTQEGLIVVGGTETYEARCRTHHSYT